MGDQQHERHGVIGTANRHRGLGARRLSGRYRECAPGGQSRAGAVRDCGRRRVSRLARRRRGLVQHGPGHTAAGRGFWGVRHGVLVRWHRFLLLGETATPSLFPRGWGTFFLTTIKVLLAFLVGAFVLGMIGAVPPHFLTGLIAAIGFIAMGFAWARVSLVFPAAAIERPITLREGWDVMAGNYWRLFACILGCYLPFGIVHYIVDKIGGGMPSILWIVFQAVALAVSFAGVAVVASLLSDVYRGFSPPQPQAAERRAS